MDESLPQMTMGLNHEDDLLAVIAGTGPYKFVGPGLRTYPTARDSNQQKLHAACLKLQARGLVRALERGNVWLWTAI